MRVFEAAGEIVNDRYRSTHSEPQIANGFAAKTLLKLAQNLRLHDAFEFVMQRRLEDADIEDAFA